VRHFHQRFFAFLLFALSTFVVSKFPDKIAWSRENCDYRSVIRMALLSSLLSILLTIFVFAANDNALTAIAISLGSIRAIHNRALFA